MKRHKLIRPSVAEDRRINAGIKADPDTHALTAQEIASMKPWQPRGRPKSATHKVPVTVRLEPRVVDFFRAGGRGWQTRMNDMLTGYVDRQRRQAK